MTKTYVLTYYSGSRSDTSHGHPDHPSRLHRNAKRGQYHGGVGCGSAKRHRTSNDDCTRSYDLRLTLGRVDNRPPKV